MSGQEMGTRSGEKCGDLNNLRKDSSFRENKENQRNKW